MARRVSSRCLKNRCRRGEALQKARELIDEGRPFEADTRRREILATALNDMALDDTLALCETWSSDRMAVNRYWWSFRVFTRKNLSKKDIRRVMNASCERAALRQITDPGMNVPDGLTIPGVVLLPCYMRPTDPACATSFQPRRGL